MLPPFIWPDEPLAPDCPDEPAAPDVWPFSLPLCPVVWLPVWPVLLWLPVLLPVPALLSELPEDGDDGVVLCAATHAVQQSRIRLNRIDFVIVNTPVCWC